MQIRETGSDIYLKLILHAIVRHVPYRSTAESDARIDQHAWIHDWFARNSNGVSLCACCTGQARAPIILLGHGRLLVGHPGERQIFHAAP